MNRRILAAVILLTFCAGLLGLNYFIEDEPPTWAQQANQGCRSKVFDLPTSILPPDLVTLLGDTASRRDAELRSELLASINEFAGQAFPGVPVNLNCDRSSYDPDALNVYFVARDPDQQFLWAKGIILDRSDANRVIIFGQEFWEFFGQAWGPIWGWKNEVSDRDYLSGLADYYLDAYGFYLEWAVAHELGHIRLGHHARAGLWRTSEEQQMEVAADIEAARIMRRQYHLLSGYLLGLVKETLKSGFYETYHRRWKQEDGDPFQSDWRIRVKQCSETHPPFIVRSLSMLEAAANVEQEQAKEIQKQKEEGIQQALSEGSDEESQIALEQLKEKKSAEPELAQDSSTAVIQLAHHLHDRIIIERPMLGICFDKLPSFLRKRTASETSLFENSLGTGHSETTGAHELMPFGSATITAGVARKPAQGSCMEKRV
jgi:hypothetical protein